MPLSSDLRHSFRSLGQRPGFLLALIATVALGIGTNAVVLGFTNGMMSRRAGLPGNDLTIVLSRQDDGSVRSLSYPQYLALKPQASIFAGLAAVRETRATVIVGDRSVLAVVATATPDARTLLGLAAGDGVLISEEFRRREVRGRLTGVRITVDGSPLPVAGTAPAWLDGLYAGRPVDLWMLTGDESSLASYGHSQTLSVIGRPRDGLSMRQVQQALDAVPGAGSGFVARPYTGLAPEMQEGIGRVGRLMAAVAAAVFLIACANVMLFLLSRAADRSHDTSLRLALGATRRALRNAVLVDSALIAVAGGAAGLVAAAWTMDVIPALLFESDAADLLFVPDIAGAIAATIMSVLITVGCGMVPLLEQRHDTPGAVMRREPRRSSKLLRRLRTGLVVFQMTACCVLIISSASVSEALNAALRTSAGERLGRPILVTVEAEKGFDRPDLGMLYFRRVQETLQDEPGITSSTWLGTLPGQTPSLYGVTVEPPHLATRDVTATAGPFTVRSLDRVILPPRAGRMFGGQDTIDSCTVVIVNESAAPALFPDRAVGRVIGDPEGRRVEIAGVVALRPPPPRTADHEPAIYYYTRQGPVRFDPRVPATFTAPVLPPLVRGVVNLYVVSSDYFQRMGLSLRAGQPFTDGPPRDVCRAGVINEEAAQLYFDGDAVGGALIDGAGLRTTIVGVVQDVRLRATQRAVEPALYVPMAENFQPRMHLLLGSADAGVELQQAIRRRVATIDGGKPRRLSVMSLADSLRRTALAPERIAALLLAVASVNALAIGILGVYRVIADDVMARRREIAVRSALGAQRWQLVRMVVIQALRFAAIGGILGIVAARLLGRWLTTTTGFAGPRIGWVWLAGPAVLVIAALLASLVSARWLLRVPPVAAMRTD